jgi:predicted ArsR family transcriptional regulator
MGAQIDIDDILGANYPNAPGWKARDTAQAAAEAIAPQAKTLRARIMDELRKAPGTPEQIALRLKAPLMNVRPRCSELARQGLIVDSEARGTAMGGRKAIIWKVAA